MPLVIDIQAQAAFKAFVTGTSHTSPIRNWFQEPYLAKPLLYGRDIRAVQPTYADTQAQADAYAAANPTVVQKITLKKMTLVPGTNGNAFGLFDTPGDPNSTLLGNWVSPFDGSGLGYFPRFYRDAAGTDEITTAFGPTNWFFHAYSGLLVWGGEDATDNWISAGVSEVYATVYRYIGPTLESVTGGASKAPVIFNQGRHIPSNGIRYMKLGEVASSVAPWIVPSDATIDAISIGFDQADATNVYDVEVLINDVVQVTVTVPTGTRKVVQSVTQALCIRDEVKVRISRQSGSGKSAFRNSIVTLQLSGT